MKKLIKFCTLEVINEFDLIKSVSAGTSLPAYPPMLPEAIIPREPPKLPIGT